MLTLLTRRHLLGWVGKVCAGILAFGMASGQDSHRATEDWSHVETDAWFVWPTVSGNLSGAQSFRAWVRKRGIGEDPTARVELYVAGVHRATVVPDTPVTSTKGEYLEGEWNATALGISSSAGVEMVVVTKGARGGMAETADWYNTATPHQWVAR